VLGGVPGQPAHEPSSLELCPSAGVSPRQGHSFLWRRSRLTVGFTCARTLIEHKAHQFAQDTSTTRTTIKRAACGRQVQHLLAGEPAFPPDETAWQCL